MELQREDYSCYGANRMHPFTCKFEFVIWKLGKDH